MYRKHVFVLVSIFWVNMVSARLWSFKMVMVSEDFGL